MSTPNPLLPQGAITPKKFNVRVAVFTTAAVHLVLLSGLLIQGCKQSAKTDVTAETTAPASDFGAMTTDPLAASNTFDTAMAASNLPDPTSLTAAAPSGTATPTTTAGATVATTTYVPSSATPTTTTASTAGVTAPATVGNTGYVTELAGTTGTAVVVPTGETQTHSVAKGEMLSTIAKKYHVSVKAVQDANPTVNPMRMQIGQKLVIPAPAPKTETAATTSAPAATTTEAASSRVYVVKSGDALEKIAKNNGVSVKALKSANGLRTDRINVGQKLKLPVKTAAAVETAPTAVVPEVMAAAPAAPTGTVTR